MSRIILIPFVLLLLVPLVCEAERLGEKIMAGQSLEELRKSHQASQARKATLVNAEPRSCGITVRDLPCVQVRQDRFEFLQPFPVALDPALTTVKGLTFSWAPEASVDEGRSSLAPLLRSAKFYQPLARPLPLACRETAEECMVAVNVLEEPNRQALAICTAGRSGKQLGPPTRCEVVAVRHGPEWWLKILDVLHLPLAQMLLPVYTLEVRGLPRSSMLASLDQALSRSPLRMPDRSVKRDRVMALAPKRFSRVLSGGWFEWAQVLVELDEELRVEWWLGTPLAKTRHSSFAARRGAAA